MLVPSLSTQQLRQLGEIHCHPPRFILAQVFSRRSALQLVIEVERAERWLVLSFTMKLSSRSSIDQGGGKGRMAGAGSSSNPMVSNQDGQADQSQDRAVPHVRDEMRPRHASH